MIAWTSAAVHLGLVGGISGKENTGIWEEHYVSTSHWDPHKSSIFQAEAFKCWKWQLILRNAEMTNECFVVTHPNTFIPKNKNISRKGPKSPHTFSQ